MLKKYMYVIGISITLFYIGYTQSQSALNTTPLTLTTQRTKTKETIYIHVSGEIARPGLYKVHRGITQLQLITLVGGLTQKAHIDRINLAKVHTKHTHLHIPPKKRTPSSRTPKTQNLSDATVDTLCELPGIGPHLAKKIISLRNQGQLKKCADLKTISGIGTHKLNRVCQYLWISD